MEETESPPIQHYEILQQKTISKKGRWWTLLVLLKDPEKEQTFMALYKFQKRIKDEESYWSKHSSFRINNTIHVRTLIESLQILLDVWEK